MDQPAACELIAVMACQMSWPQPGNFSLHRCLFFGKFPSQSRLPGTNNNKYGMPLCLAQVPIKLRESAASEQPQQPTTSSRYSSDHNKEDITSSSPINVAHQHIIPVQGIIASPLIECMQISLFYNLYFHATQSSPAGHTISQWAQSLCKSHSLHLPSARELGKGQPGIGLEQNLSVRSRWFHQVTPFYRNDRHHNLSSRRDHKETTLRVLWRQIEWLWKLYLMPF